MNSILATDRQTKPPRQTLVEEVEAGTLRGMLWPRAIRKMAGHHSSSGPLFVYESSTGRSHVEMHSEDNLINLNFPDVNACRAATQIR